MPLAVRSPSTGRVDDGQDAEGTLSERHDCTVAAMARAGGVGRNAETSAPRLSAGDASGGRNPASRRAAAPASLAR